MGGGHAASRTRANVQLRNLGNGRGGAKVGQELGRVVHQAPVRGKGPSCKVRHGGIKVGRAVPQRLVIQQPRLERRGNEVLQAALPQRGIGVLLRDDFTLLSEPQARANGARGLCEDGVV